MMAEETHELSVEKFGDWGEEKQRFDQITNEIDLSKQRDLMIEVSAELTIKERLMKAAEDIKILITIVMSGDEIPIHLRPLSRDERSRGIAALAKMRALQDEETNLDSINEPLDTIADIMSEVILDTPISKAIKEKENWITDGLIIGLFLEGVEASLSRIGTDIISFRKDGDGSESPRDVSDTPTEPA